MSNLTFITAQEAARQSNDKLIGSGVIEKMWERITRDISDEISRGNALSVVYIGFDDNQTALSKCVSRLNELGYTTTVVDSSTTDYQYELVTRW